MILSLYPIGDPHVATANQISYDPQIGTDDRGGTYLGGADKTALQHWRLIGLLALGKHTSPCGRGR
jgi:hypothetical protein